MSYYAFLDDDNIVTEVIAGVPDSEKIEGMDPAEWYSAFRGQRCLLVSLDGSIRKNGAGVGAKYDEETDGFIFPQPFPSWTFNQETYGWEPPVPHPSHDPENPDAATPYYWDEDKLSWVEISIEEEPNA